MDQHYTPEMWAAELDNIVEEIKAALAALAEDTGRTLSDGELREYAWDVIYNHIPDPDGDREDRHRRFEAVAKTARPFLKAVQVLSPWEAEELFLGPDWGERLRLCLSHATQVASQKPPRRRGRKTKLDTLGVAVGALYAFETVTDTPATITVDPITSEAGGRYLELVSMAFRLLTIDASSEHYAKKAVEWMRSEQNGQLEDDKG